MAEKRNDDPQSVELEAEVLGVIMVQPRRYVAAAAHLTQEAFYYPSHGLIWEIMTRLNKRGIAPDGAAVLDELRSHKQLGDVGGTQYIKRLVDQAIPGSNIQHHARKIKETWILRLVIQETEQIAAKARQGDTPLSQVLDFAQERIYALSDRGVSQADIEGAGQLVGGEVDSILEKLATGAALVSGYDTGIDLLNNAIGGGWRPGDLVTIAAQPKRGKSKVAIFSAAMLARSSIPVGYLSLDMRKQRFVQYLGSTLSALSGERIPSMALEALGTDQLIKMGNAAKGFQDTFLAVCSSRYNTMGQIEAYIRKFKQLGAPVVFIDQCQRVAEWNEGLNRQNRGMLESVVDGFKWFAELYNVAIVLLHQIKREVDGRPSIEDLKETGAFQERSDVVLILHDEQTYMWHKYNGFDLDFDYSSGTYIARKPKTLSAPAKTEVQNPRPLDIQVAANRGGGVKDLRVQFDYSIGVHVDFVENNLTTG